MARRTAPRPAPRKAEAARSRLEAEVVAIALVVVALLSAVAFFVGEGLLRIWRDALEGGFGLGAFLVPPLFLLTAVAVWLEIDWRRAAVPVAGAALATLSVLGLASIVHSNFDPAPTAGGAIGAQVGGRLAGQLTGPGAAVVLLALLLVGLAIASRRTLGQLLGPLWGARTVLLAREPRPPARPARTEQQLWAARTDVMSRAPEPRGLPVAEDDDAPIRINLPPDRTGTRAASPKAVPAATQLPLSAAATALAASPHPPSVAGLASAVVTAEGVLHAAPPTRPWALPSLDMLAEGTAARASREEVLRNGQVIEETLAHFSITAKVVEASVGPVVTRYELKPAAGVKLSRIEALADDLSLALAARSLRIEAPVPGKSVVGIEIPNLAIGLVSLKDVVETATFKDAGSRLTVALGRDVAGSPIVLDLAKLPHLLVAGQTGSGKSVCLSSIICSLLLASTPDEVRFLIGDLKRVDFAGFNGVPHLVVPVMTDHEKILNALYWLTGEMDRRYRLFARASARNIASYNETRTGADRIPYVVFIIDELADLMLQAPIQVEKQITRVAQLARATGIHLVLGTQRPSVDVITGLIKANIPARIAFATASAVDSRTILDMTGAEKLLGRGDMLVLPPDLAKPVRAQGVFVSDREIASVTQFWRDQGGLDFHAEVTEGEERTVRTRLDGGDDEIDDARYDEALEIVRRAGQASVSMLQRKMTIGFARAGRLIDLMEQQGAIGPSVGPGKMREVYGGVAPRKAAGNGADEEA